MKAVRLGDVIKIHHGWAFPGSGFGTDAELPQLITPGNFEPGGSFVRRVKSFSGEFPSAFILEPGDLVVSMTDLSKEGATLGKPAIVPSDGIFLHNQRRGKVEILDESALDKNYLKALFLTGEFHRQILSTATGSTVRHTSPRRIYEFCHSLPELEAQRAIGEVLGALDDKIAANRQVVGTSVTLATQIIAREAVGSDRPLSEIADVQMGSSPRGAELNEDGDGMEFFQGVRDFGELSPTPRVFATVTPRRAKADATLLAVRAPVGEVNWARNETCIGRGLADVRSEDAPTTIHYLLRRFACRWDEHEGSGTVFSSVTGPQVKAMQFPTVPEASAGEVEQLLASIHQRALSAEAESEVISRTRDELLPLLMNGRITVKDAERAAEDVL
ncbi:MAG: restriction endonuclease subunit S [Dietzia sp.]|nr:restriction endonuclease subunit S [Dietzia sp.]